MVNSPMFGAEPEPFWERTLVRDRTIGKLVRMLLDGAGRGGTVEWAVSLIPLEGQEERP